MISCSQILNHSSFNYLKYHRFLLGFPLICIISARHHAIVQWLHQSTPSAPLPTAAHQCPPMPTNDFQTGLGEHNDMCRCIRQVLGVDQSILKHPEPRACHFCSATDPFHRAATVFNDMIQIRASNCQNSELPLNSRR